MFPTLALLNRFNALLAADATTLAPAANANKVALISADFVPSQNLLVGDLTYAAGFGLDPVSGVVGGQLDSTDPETGELVTEVKVPAGAFRWETTAGFVPPLTIYGFGLTDDGATKLFGTVKLPAPIVLTAIGQSYTTPPITFKLPFAAIR